MRIGIDIQTTLGQKSGFGFYVENLVRELKKIDQKNQYTYFVPRKETDLSMPERFFWDQVSIPWQASRAKIEILHQPSFSLPLAFSGKVIVTVHDLIAILYGKHIPFFSRQFFSRWMPFTYRRADHIICISENTKKDLVRILEIPEEKITVNYLAASSDYRPKRGKENILLTQRVPLGSKLKISSPYFFHVGTLSPRKNLVFLVEVFSEVLKKHPDFQLILAGRTGWYCDRLFERIQKLRLEDKVIFADYLTEQEKIVLYQNAFAFLFPSIYEGFGLPLLEAMQSGVPVISSDASSMPEVIGKAGIMVSPKDKDGWVNAVIRLIENNHLRQSLIVQGFKQAAKFSWSQHAQKTLELYEKVYRL
jgi:glycosyltransferase involved in cell wall biosynthesis